ncbi:phosphatidylserine/phosphatidylglycerophosphate/cardiolipin synthase family protein [Halobacteriovorax sp. DA5]|uniref:phospholipase D-like domain-containing protein n=1 Tax=Halobacteriovorax sp. DA5 TaxID=2067553 RepID=UPI0013048E69|nr:phosphatidylserine/phosphatidylglycerophosphate/cardiolipin synthase family protein [Halobacteriovorax sp. DA5]
MNRIYKLSLKIITGIILLIAAMYAVLLAYIYYTDNKEVKVVSNIKSIYSRMKTPHQLEVIPYGVDSFIKRIEMIQNAAESIEVEFFIYDLDLASKVVTSELIKASQRGVQVRILVDFSIAVFKLAPEYTNYLKEKGIEVRYYNTVSNTNFIAVQHRNHRKLLIIDGKIAMTGGRNIANDYFDLGENYNFHDFDITVEGKVVKDIRQSFFSYWESDYASVPELPSENLQSDFFNIGKDSARLMNYLTKVKEEIHTSENKFECNDITYITDSPGVLVSNRQVYRRLEELVKSAKSEFLVESPYLVLRSDGANLIKSAIDNGVEFSILTNSLFSTDAYYTAAALALNLRRIHDLGLKTFVYNGTNSYESYKLLNTNEHSKWGVHSKRAVIDGKHTIVGTYNIDPRSANLNSEMVIICRDNPELAKAVRDDIKLRMNHSRELHGHEIITRGAGTMEKLKFYLSMPLVYFLDFLL